MTGTPDVKIVRKRHTRGRVDILGVRSAILTDQPCLVSGVKYVTKTSPLDRGVTSLVFAKVLICSRETEALRFDGEIPLPVKDFQQVLSNILETACLKTN